MNECPQCGSTETRWTGYLGHLTWASCRGCGAEYATLREHDEQANHEDDEEYMATQLGRYLSDEDEVIDHE